MQRSLSFVLALGLVSLMAVVAVGAPPAGPAADRAADPHAGISPDDPRPPLPKYATAEELLVPLEGPTRGDFENRSPPTGVVYCPPEYAPQDGMLLAWEGYTTVLQEMAVGVTTNDPDAIVYVVVDNGSEQTSAYNSLNGAGADMTQVEFIVRGTDSVWIRDYGPRMIYEDGIRSIVDHNYNRPARPNDNLLNDYLSTLWGDAHYDIPLTHGGGNFHLFANGDGFISTLILNENPGLSEQDVIDLYSEYQNLDVTIYPRFPSYIDSTGHIDMWMMPLEDDKVIISEWASGPAKTITDDATADLISRGYTVIRVPAWNSGSTHYTYTNAVIFNDLLFISWFGGSYTSQDAQVLAIYQAAMPNHQIIQVYCGSIIQAAGAIHCIMMHVPAYPLGPIPVVTVVSPNGSEAWTAGQEYAITWTALDDVGVTGLDIYYSTDGGASYPQVIATDEPNDGVFNWTVPETVSDQCRVKIVAHDADLNSGEDVSDGDFAINPAPVMRQAFSLDSDPGWSTEGGWAFGEPIGGGSSNGDPVSGYTGTNVYGYNLSGDYDNNMPVYYLTTTAIDCSLYSGTQLRFSRWLGIEGRPKDHASIEVSSNGTDWTVLWRHESGSFSESSWSPQMYDISTQADGQATVYVRWSMGPTNESITYPGWNIDDVEIWAAAPQCAMTGDMNDDAAVDGDDIGDFASCYLGGDPNASGCACADADNSGAFDNSDITLFIEALLLP